jgi:hypothetical protein
MALRHVVGTAVMVLAGVGPMASAAVAGPSPEEVELTWTNMVLLLTRHTPTYSPPVASRTFAYLSVAAYEAVAAGSSDLQSLSGQLNGLTAGPTREAGAKYDEAVVLTSTMAPVIAKMFDHTGPIGQNALEAQRDELQTVTEEGVPADVVKRSEEFGAAVAAHILDWAKDDGGAEVENMGFPYPGEYTLIAGPSHWVPTSAIVQQQLPLLPAWGKIRPYAMPADLDCKVPPPPEYSEDPGSEFYKQAKEVYDTKNALTPEQAAIARFWSDDPMLSWTPPGHWINIVMQILVRDHVPLEKAVDAMMRVSVAEADAFIGCWQVKFTYDLVRPLTYIRRVIDPKWETLINTPPFPEYDSGHSVSSAAAATVLTSIFGDNFAFDDTTGSKDNLAPHSFKSFWEAARQAGISRLYGGIHYRAAIENGLKQGECIAAYSVGLKTWRQ